MAHGFLKSLPGEIRNQIYAELLSTDDVIALSNLRRDKACWPVAQTLGLTPALLRTCAQINDEATPFLYWRNTFFQEIEAPWEFESSALWRRCFERFEEPLTTCLASAHREDGPSRAVPSPWGPMVSSIGKLQVSIRSYSYFEWRFRHPSGLADEDRCDHVIKIALPPLLRLELLCIRILPRCLLAGNDIHNRENWTTVALGYETSDANRWRRCARHDLRRHLRQLLDHATLCSDTVIVAGKNYGPYIDRDVDGRLPLGLRQLLYTGKLIRSSKIKAYRELPPSSYMMRETLQKICAENDELLICPSGQEVAAQSIYY